MKQIKALKLKLMSLTMWWRVLLSVKAVQRIPAVYGWKICGKIERVMDSQSTKKINSTIRTAAD